MTNIAIDNGPVEIVDFTIKNGGSFHCYVRLLEGTLLCDWAMNPQFSGNPGASQASQASQPTCSCNREVLLSDKEAEARSLRRMNFEENPHVSTNFWLVGLVGGLNPCEKYESQLG